MLWNIIKNRNIFLNTLEQFDYDLQIGYSTSYKKETLDVCLCFDIPMDWQVNFQDQCIRLIEGLLNLHQDIIFIIVTIITLVFYLLIRVIFGEKLENRNNWELNYSTIEMFFSV